jgi:hypothetical protein
MRLVLVLFLISVLSGCAGTQEFVRAGPTVPKLDPSKVVYISIPKDSRRDQIDYTGSGQSTTQIVLMAFSQYSTRVETGQEYQTFEKAVESARQQGAGYLVVPKILEWENRATEWPGIPDATSIKISVFDTASGTTIDSVIIRGNGGSTTLGGNHPQDSLPKPVDEYVKSLFQ